MNNTNNEHAALAMATLNFIASKHNVAAPIVYAAYLAGDAVVVGQFRELMGIAWEALRK